MVTASARSATPVCEHRKVRLPFSRASRSTAAARSAPATAWRTDIMGPLLMKTKVMKRTERKSLLWLSLQSLATCADVRLLRRRTAAQQPSASHRPPDGGQKKCFAVACRPSEEVASLYERMSLRRHKPANICCEVLKSFRRQRRAECGHVIAAMRDDAGNRVGRQLGGQRCAAV